jgi:hypothetical protein
VRIDRSPIFLDLVGGGAWPFLVGGVICLVYSDNERDSGLLTSRLNLLTVHALLRGTSSAQLREKEQ